MSTTAAAF